MDDGKKYLKNSLYPLMYLFRKNSMPDVNNLLTSFYQLDDEARKEVVETIQFKLQYHKDKERAEPTVLPLSRYLNSAFCSIFYAFYF